MRECVWYWELIVPCEPFINWFIESVPFIPRENKEKGEKGRREGAALGCREGTPSMIQGLGPR